MLQSKMPNYEESLYLALKHLVTPTWINVKLEESISCHRYLGYYIVSMVPHQARTIFQVIFIVFIKEFSQAQNVIFHSRHIIDIINKLMISIILKKVLPFPLNRTWDKSPKVTLTVTNSSSSKNIFLLSHIHKDSHILLFFLFPFIY